jgi:membrane-associated phospholipid phosphatase
MAGRVSFALPLFLTRRNRWTVGALVFAVGGLLYLVSNHYSFSPPRELPLTALDRAIPFVPYTVWIYMSEWVFFVAVYVAARDVVNLNKYLYSFFAQQALAVLIFMVWPTTYPRGLFPLPDSLERVTYAAFSALRLADAPTNCCPSLHVSSVFLSSFIFLDDRRARFPWFFGWATAIALSTLTTKQHYVVDVVTGFVFHRWMPYRPARRLVQA